MTAPSWWSCRDDLRDVASFHAIHDSRAHFTRAGNFATPAKAMPSSSTSSSGSTCPRPCIRVRNSSCTASASVDRAGRSPGRSSPRSAAWLIEQPSASYDTSSTTASVAGAGEVHPQGDLVAAGRVDVVHLGLERLAQPRVVRVLVVVQDDLLVEARVAGPSAHLEVRLGVLQPLDERVDLGRRRVEVRRRAGRALHAEPLVRRAWRSGGRPVPRSRGCRAPARRRAGARRRARRRSLRRARPRYCGPSTVRPATVARPSRA